MKKDFVVSALLLLLVFSDVKGQKLGFGTNVPNARFHFLMDSLLSMPIMQVETQGKATPHFVISNDGKVGINIGAPSEILDVAGNIKFSGALMPNGNAGTVGQVLVSQGPGNPPQWQTPGSGGLTIICSSPMVNYVQKWMGTELCNSLLYDDGTNVGINTNSPTRTLDINGNLRIRNIVNVAIPFSGSVLVADTSGNVDGIPFPGDTSLVLRGDGSWGQATIPTGKVFTAYQSGPTSSNFTLSIPIPGLLPGQTIVVWGNGDCLTSDQSGANIQIDLLHNSTVLEGRNYWSNVGGASISNREACPIMGITTAIGGGADTIKVSVQFNVVPGALAVYSYRVIAIVF